MLLADYIHERFKEYYPEADHITVTGGLVVFIMRPMGRLTYVCTDRTGWYTFVEANEEDPSADMVITIPLQREQS